MTTTITTTIQRKEEGAVHVHGYNQVDLITNDNIMRITYTMPIVQLNDDMMVKMMTMIIITTTMKKKHQTFQALKIII